MQPKLVHPPAPASRLFQNSYIDFVSVKVGRLKHPDQERRKKTKTRVIKMTWTQETLRQRSGRRTTGTDAMVSSTNISKKRARTGSSTPAHPLCLQHGGLSTTLLLWAVIVIIAAVILCLPTAVAQSDTTPAVPPNKYHIGDPSFEQERLTVKLTYPVSDFVPFDNLRYRLYDNDKCGRPVGDDSESPDGVDDGDITRQDYLVIDIITDEATAPLGDGSVYRNYTLAINFDPEKVRQSSIFTADNPTTLSTTIAFCVKLSAMTAEGINPVAAALFNRETFVTLQVLQTGELADEYIVADGSDTNPVTEGRDYALIGFFCNENNEEIAVEDGVPLFSGQSVRVCVTPDDVAKQANVYMRLIESFAWTRESIFQSAVNYKQVPANEFTTVDCQPGISVCSVTTFLKPQFFYSKGVVAGSGVAWLQFGTGACPETQRARILIKSHQSLISSQQGDTDQQSRVLTTEGASIAIAHLPEHFTRQVDTLQADGGGEVAQSGSNCEGQASEGWAGDGVFIVEQPVTRLYRANAYLCDENNVELVPEKNPLGVGEVARICIKPEELAAREDNVRIRSIDWLKWSRQGNNFTQAAITTNSQPESTTEIFCERGSIVCVVETVLDAGFYDEQGFIDGKGVVWFQFGEESEASDARRDLQVDPELALGPQVLQNMEKGFAGASPFEVSIVNVPPKDKRETYLCIAYECDDKLQKIEPQQQEKTEGAYVRMCVQPADFTMFQGVNMWMIESWKWWRKNVTQDAVVSQGVESPDGRTLLTCYRGDPICTFVTRLRDEFFNDTGAMFGDGNCWLSFGTGGDPFLAPIATDGAADEEKPAEEGPAEDEEIEIDPEQDGLYAGGNLIAYEFPVTGNWKPPEIVCPEEDHQLGVWWDQLDDVQRWMIIASLASVTSSICCIWVFCLVGGYRKKRNEIVKEENEGQKVVVNLDLNEAKTENNMQSSTTTENTALSDQQTSSQRTMDNGGPEPQDICFGEKHHPGTRDCIKCVASYRERYPDQTYTPDSYREITNQLLKRQPNRHFYMRDPVAVTDSANNPNSGWRICSKHEIISFLGEIWRDVKRKEERKSRNR